MRQRDLRSLPSPATCSTEGPSEQRVGKIVASGASVSAKTACIHVLNGPNLNLLGDREPEIYGNDTLADVEGACRELCEAVGAKLVFEQTNSQGTLIDQIHAARNSAGIVINPAGYSYSVAVLDALKACTAPIVEVHISNIHARAAAEPFRAESLTAKAALGVISGLGIAGYGLAVQFLLSRGEG